MKTQLKADIMLLIVTLGWGVSYYLMDIALGDVDTFTLNAYRFLGAFFIAAVFTFPKIRTVNRETLKYSLLVGIALVFVYTGATFGVKYTTLSNSGFLCALTVLFVPVFEFFLFRKKPQKKIVLAVTVSLIGIMLLTLQSDLSINMDNLKGDLMCVMCAVAYALDLIITGKAVEKPEVNAYQLGVFQLGVTGTCMLILAFLTESPHLPQSGAVWGSIIFLSVFCTGIAFIVQAVAQQYTTPSHVGVIFTLEPVFAGIVAFFLAGEVLTARAYAGAILMIAALFITEIDFSGIKGRFKGSSK